MAFEQRKIMLGTSLLKNDHCFFFQDYLVIMLANNEVPKNDHCFFHKQSKIKTPFNSKKKKP